MGRGTVVLLVLLMLCGGVLSGVLVLERHGERLGGTAEAICDATTGGCEQVANSEYATVHGISVAAVGLFFYLSMLMLFVLSSLAGEATRRAAGALAFVAVGAALVVDLMLLGVQAFVIGAFCALCLLTYLVNAAALFLLWSSKGAVGSLLEALGQGEGRLALAGWALGSLAVAATILVGELALGQRAEAREKSVLGAPIAAAATQMPPAAPATTPPAAVTEHPAEAAPTTASSTPNGEATPPTTSPAAASAGQASQQLAALQNQLEVARKKAQQLQETLDDPRKLAVYEDQKASAEFAAAKRETFDLSHAPSKGAAGAPVDVVEFSDFLCPYCKSLADGLAGYLPQSGGRVRIFFKNYPLDKDCNSALNASVHPGSCHVALGGVCANEQEHFWAYHDAVFANPPKNPTQETVVALAGSAGLDADAFRQCLASPEAQARLQADIAEGQRLGVHATPTLYLNGKKLPRISDFLRAVDSEVKAKSGGAGASPGR